MLLNREYPYVHKPSDFGGAHGGASRIDWLFSTREGFFGAIEVKSTHGVTFNLFDAAFMSPLQRMALNDLAQADLSIVWLAVGIGDVLHWYSWRHLETHQSGERVKIAERHAASIWNGEKHWLANIKLPWEIKIHGR